MELMERRIGQLLFAGVVGAAGCLASGLLAWIGGAEAASLLLNAGLIILMATPVMRVVLSIAEYARMRDWTFVLTACAVLVILAVSVLYAYGSAQ